MSRIKKTEDGAPEQDGAEETTSESTYVYIDYRGTIGAAPGQREIDHESSPLLLWTAERDAMMFAIHPGLNVIERSVWAKHRASKSDTGKQLQGELDEGRITELSELPVGAELQRLIERTIDNDALEALRAHVLDAIPPGHGRADRRQVLINAIDTQLKTRTQARFEPLPYQIGVPAALLKGRANRERSRANA